ncbi:MAG TPA: O-methyltransferase [Anaerovoracaceae bacterium]|nr:O-methyltransferase [Anaerovoracaceae bacterium]
MNITNDRITEYLEEFYRPLSKELGKLREYAEEQQIPVITKDTEALLLNIIRMKKPDRILEIGTAVGYSAICFATAVPEAFVVSLEVSEPMYRSALENVERFGLTGRIRVLRGDAVDSLKLLAGAMKSGSGNSVDSEGFDLVFIDAAKSLYKEFWDGCIPLCRKEAVIVSDNVLLKARTASDEYITERRQKTSVRHMREYIKYITKSKDADTALLPVGDGVAVSVLKR